MIKEFNQYVNNFDISDENIMLKIKHSVRVAEKMKEFAKQLKFSNDEIALAFEIGLLHDIGRFKQLQTTNSYTDNEMFDHADYGVKFLFDEGNINNYNINKAHYEAIKHAIYQHNKYCLEKHSDKIILDLSKLIRDVDKIDILYILGTLGTFDEKCDDSDISIEVLKSIQNHKSVNWVDVKTNNDKIAQRFAFVFDINYNISLKEFKENLTTYYNKIEPNQKIDDIWQITIKYLNERIDKQC